MAADELEQLFQQEMLMAQAGRSAAQAYEQLADKLNKSAEAAKKAAATATAAAKAQKEWDDKLKAVGSSLRSATTMFISADAAMTGFAASASPAAFATLSGHIQLLSATIGKAYMPALATTITWIDRARHYVEGLDQDMLKNVATWVSVAGAVGIAGKAFSVLASSIGLVPAAAASAMTALTALASVRMAETQKIVNAATGPTTKAGIGQDKEIQDILGSFETDKIKEQQLQELNKQRSAKARKANDRAGALAGDNPKFIAAAEMFGATGYDRSQREAGQAVEAQANVVDVLMALKGVGGDFSKLDDSLKKRLPAGGDKDRLPPVAWPREMQPGFNPIENARRNVQVAGLGTDPVQAELLKINRESYQLFLDNLPKIKDGVSKPGGFGP